MYIAGIILLVAGATVLAWYFGLLGIILDVIGYIPTVVIIAVLFIIIGVILIKGAFLIKYDSHKRNTKEGFGEFDYDEVMYTDWNETDSRKRF